MIYFLHGTDTDKARVKSHEMIDMLQKKKPDASVFSMNSETWSASAIDEYAGGQGLFSKKYIVLVDRVSEDKNLRDELVETLPLMKESENIFIILEGRLDKATLTKIEKNAEKTQEFGEKVGAGGAGVGFWGKGGATETSVFAIADALGRRDRRELWVLYREFIDAGKSPEEIHGTLFWQAKSMAIAARSKSVADSGLSPFVFNKSKTYAENYPGGELEKLLDKLIAVSHDARRGKHEMETGMEGVLLGV